MLAAFLSAVATRVPVAPLEGRAASDISVLTLFLPALIALSPRSIMPVGGLIVALMAVPKIPTRTVLATVVNTDGAVIDAELEFAKPPATSIGFTRSTPPYAAIPPEAASPVENVQV